MIMDFTMIKNCFDWGFYQKPDDIKIYVQVGNITSDEFKQITGQNYVMDQEQNSQSNQNVQTNQGTTSQNTAQQ